MGDVFKEQLVKTKGTTKDNAQKWIIIVSAILLGIVAFIFGGFIGPFIVVGLVWGAIYLVSFSKKEYEYSLTNNELDIDVIYNKERRKRLISINLKEIDVMASIKEDRHRDALERAQKTIDVSDGVHTKDTYAIVYAKDSVLTRVLLSPNEEMLTLIYKQAPHKVFKFKG